MGRKKIDIRPLVDERNRNVTFLKRKAGLMKKAWELSVLCAADVSILIFSSSGKPYEFSSHDLDEELDRYLEYEGSIERRRGEEFAAMAAAGEDDDDDEDEKPMKVGPGTTSTAPTKSLKGKESFKPRMTSRADLVRARRRTETKDKDKGKRRREVSEKRSFVEDTFSQSDESESESTPEPPRPIRKTSHGEVVGVSAFERPRSPARTHSADLTHLHYALNSHALPGPSHNPHESYTNPSTQYRLPPNATAFRVATLSNQHYPPPPQQPQHQHQQQQQYYSGYPPASTPSHQQQPPPQPQQLQQPQQQQAYYPTLPSGMQWDPALVARYAEFQLQQNHQRQQRALLERQRQQLAELGIPVEDKTLLDQLFGGMSGTPSGSGGPSTGIGGSSGGGGNDSAQTEQGFDWPNVNRSNQPLQGLQGYGMLQGLGSSDGGQVGGPGNDDENLAWAFGEDTSGAGGGTAPLPSPASEGSKARKRDRTAESYRTDKKVRI
ncbi:hypothetical protein BCR39DRAFT_530351 [Naematelia encephala]|uniref:MADS-box domain-containing protein n=1 Tax=Naematelia encephala TaxID=71784 RepID=A0A1Y2B673_9TREE|nr:hypothetical protein BCR39DRAFT_530351 [Naematelia encephala]